MKEKRDAGIRLLLSKITTEGAMPNVHPMNRVNAFTTNELWRDVEFNPDIIGTKTGYLSSASPSFLIQVPGRNVKTLSCRGTNPGPLHAMQRLCLWVTAVDDFNNL